MGRRYGPSPAIPWNRTPVTVGIVAAFILTFLLAWGEVQGVAAMTALDVRHAIARPWTVVTHPISTWGIGPIGLLFACLWMWGIGGTLERESGSRRVLLLCLFVALAAGMLAWGIFALGARPTVLANPFLVLAGLTVVWATRNPELGITFMFVIPLKAKYLGWIAAGIAIFSVPIVYAPAVALPLAGLWAFAANRLAWLPYAPPVLSPYRQTRREREREQAFLDDAHRREREREEKERLRRLFERSMIEDPDDRDPPART